MMAKGKLSTPEWIMEGYDSEADYNKAKGITTEKKKAHPRVYPETFSKKGLQGAKAFKIRECAKCGSDDVAVVIGEVGMWECKKCGWKGVDVVEKELTEDEFMKYLDEKGEEVA